MKNVNYKKTVIGELKNDVGEGQMNTFCCVGDFNNDGVQDFAVCGRFGEMAWFENQGKEKPWIKHHIADVTAQECGGRAFDLTGNGYPDIINGSESSNDEMSWYENPGKSDKEWVRHIIAKTGMGQQHDTLIANIKNDDTKYLIFTNQNAKNLNGPGTTVFCVPIPNDPSVTPWPGLEVIAKNQGLPNDGNPWNDSGIQPDEGLAVGDVDGDGLVELVSGVTYYKWQDGKWFGNKFTEEIYITNKILVTDIDNDGKNEIVLAEGDSYIYGHKQGGKLAWFKPKNETATGIFEEHIIETGLIDAHSITAADICGNGNMDLFIGEIGAYDYENEKFLPRKPRLMIYENDGKGNFTTRHIIDEGTGIHEATMVDLTGDGKLDIIGKPLQGKEKWNLHAYFAD